MDQQKHLETFFAFSRSPMYWVHNGERREFHGQIPPLRFFPRVEEALYASGISAAYTVSPEHVAFAMVLLPGGYLFLGPAPSVELGETQIDEAMAYAGLPPETRTAFVRLLVGIPYRDILRFRQMVAYLSAVVFDTEISEWHYVDYPAPVAGGNTIEWKKPESSDLDSYSLASFSFGRSVMRQIMHGKVDELEKVLSTMGITFSPNMEFALSKEDLHDKFVMALTEAAMAANEGGLSHQLSETMIAHYLASLRKADSFRSIVRLFKIMLNDFAARTHQAQLIQANDTLTLRVCRDIENHLHEKILPSEIAQRLKVTLPYLCAAFKQQTGKTLTAYINERKITESKYLLSKPDISVTEVAMQLGFTSSNYFSTVFRQVTGMTPLGWQNRPRHLTETEEKETE